MSEMSEREAARLPYERDYIARTIETVRNHRDADNCWPQWANIFADQIEALEVELASWKRLAFHYQSLLGERGLL